YLDTLTHFVTGAEGNFALMAGNAAQGHLLDKADIQAAFDGEVHQIQHLVIVATLLDHAIDLDSTKPRLASGIDTFEHLIELVAAGQFGKTFPFERIKTDVQTLDSGGLQYWRERGQLRTVGGDGEVFQLITGAEARQQIRQAFTYKRLAAGHANAFDTQADKASATA